MVPRLTCIDRSCTTSRPLKDFERTWTSMAISEASAAVSVIAASWRLGVEEHADRLADLKTVRLAGPRLDQIDQLAALLEAVDHRRRVFGHGGDEIDFRSEIGGAVVAGDAYLIAQGKFRQVGLADEKAHLHVAWRHDRQHRPLRRHHFPLAEIDLLDAARHRRE